MNSNLFPSLDNGIMIWYHRNIRTLSGQFLHVYVYYFFLVIINIIRLLDIRASGITDDWGRRRCNGDWRSSEYLLSHHSICDNKMIFTVKWNPDVFNLWKLFQTWINYQTPFYISPKLRADVFLLGGYVPVKSDSAGLLGFAFCTAPTLNNLLTKLRILFWFSGWDHYCQYFYSLRCINL